MSVKLKRERHGQESPGYMLLDACGGFGDKLRRSIVSLWILRGLGLPELGAVRLSCFERRSLHLEGQCHDNVPLSSLTQCEYQKIMSEPEIEFDA